MLGVGTLRLSFMFALTFTFGFTLTFEVLGVGVVTVVALTPVVPAAVTLRLVVVMREFDAFEPPPMCPPPMCP